ncbi:hypothetical protein JCM10908_001279 [Rhodotorula pacifica]|uniref:uncharacterized protein n=1 Tax=Rhodotorula pacifica TaxID=1495444 RepID=UPI0031806DBB
MAGPASSSDSPIESSQEQQRDLSTVEAAIATSSSASVGPSTSTREDTPGASLGLTFDPATESTDQPTPAQANVTVPSDDISSSSAALPEALDQLPSSTPATPARPPKQAHFTLDPPETRTISPAPRRRPSYNHSASSFSRSSSSGSHHPPNSSSSPHREPAAPTPKPTLVQTYKDLHALLKGFLLLVPPFIRRLRFLIPTPLRSAARFVIRYSAMFLHARGILGSNWVYDVVASMWRIVIDIFFREIRSRGAWKIPRQNEGAVIFVVGPHHNQFLDPLLLMSEVRRESGRRISFLTAAKSMDRAFVGLAARLAQSIPVARAQDYAFVGKGTIRLSEEDPLLILGTDTQFKKDFEKPRSQMLLPRSLGSSTAEVIEVVSDTELRLKKEFPRKAVEELKAKPEGVSFKVLPHVDQSNMYSAVYQRLTEGGSIGIFPEGGSHDRTDLLPLKAGVSIMALGAISAHPNLRLQIVPVGMSYFHPHKFRSRAVVEFGSPIDIPQEFVAEFEKGGDSKKKAIGGFMDLIVDGLKSVTVRAPDYDTLMLIQAARRLYRPPGSNLTLGQVVELNKRFIVGYEVYKEDPRIKELERGVREYNRLLRYLGLKDHQVESAGRPRWRSFFILCYRFGLLSAWGALALPGVILNAPIFIAAKLISRKKAKEALAASTVKIAGRDVLATWKVLVALAGAPSLYTVYAINAVVLAHKLGLPYKYKVLAPVATFAGLPVIGIAALKFGEVGMDVYKSMRPLLLSLIPGKEPQVARLRHMRETLSTELNELVDELAPSIFEDFQANRIVPSAAASPRRDSAQGKFLQHPLGWIDEFLFGYGWSNSMALPENRRVERAGNESDFDGGFTDGQGGGSGYVSGYTTEEAPDYDEVIHILNREQGHPDSAGTGGTHSPKPTLSRRNSRQRSRSNLAAMSPVTPTTPLPTGSSSALPENDAVRKRAGGSGEQ